MNLLIDLTLKGYRNVALCVVCALFVLPAYAYMEVAQASKKSPIITKQQAKALSMIDQKKSHNEQIKHLRLQITKLADSQGQEYLGALVSRVDLLPYLTQLKTILLDDFDVFRANQAARDHHSFHVTLINPIEYQQLDQNLVEQLLNSTDSHRFSKKIEISLLGLGNVVKDKHSTYFVVAQSSAAQFIRQRFLLKAKDFHVTLGFKPRDIYGVRKNESTLIQY